MEINNSFWRNNFTENDMKQPIIQDNFIKIGRKKSSLILLIAHDDYILKFKENSTKCKRLNLDFDIKFEVIYESDNLLQIKSLKLSSENSSHLLEIQEEGYILRRWRTYFSERINQLGFQQYFKVYQKIESKSNSQLYMANSLEFSKKVIIKSYSKQLYQKLKGKVFLSKSKDIFQDEIQNEIKIMRQLNHQRLTQLYGVYETQNTIYLSMQVHLGGTLYSHLNNSEILPDLLIQTIMWQILEGISYMHSKNFMHRNLKLENIFFHHENCQTIAIDDFAFVTQANLPVFLFNRCGTFGYVAPEILNIANENETYGVACDIYSIGIIFHILVTGTTIFPTKNKTEFVKFCKEGKINYKDDIYRHLSLPSSSLDLLKRMLEVDPQKRITAMESLQHEYFQNASDFPKQYFSPNINKRKLIDPLKKVSNTIYITHRSLSPNSQRVTKVMAKKQDILFKSPASKRIVLNTTGSPQVEAKQDLEKSTNLLPSLNSPNTIKVIQRQNLQGVKQVQINVIEQKEQPTQINLVARKSILKIKKNLFENI